MSVLAVSPDRRERRRLVHVVTKLALPGELTIAEAESAEAALAAFRRGQADLVILSPGTEVLQNGQCVLALDTFGRDVTQTIRAEEGARHTGLIVVDHIGRDARDASTLSVACLEMGADDFLRHEASPGELMARVRAVLRLKAMTDELRTANHQLRMLSLTDELTGLANMRSFNETFAERMRAVRDGQDGLAIVMMDLDHFKSVNDTANHLVGSHVLREIGRMLRERQGPQGGLGERDTAARYGGDEFVLLIQAPSLGDAAKRAEAVRRMIAAEVFHRDGCRIAVTASLGIAWIAPGFTGRAEDVVKAADLMLYRSKEHGRNRVTGMVLRYPIDLSTGATGRVPPPPPGRREASEVESDTIDFAKVLGRR